MSKRYPKVDTVNLVNADQEYSYTFPAHTKSILLQIRSGGQSFKYAYKAGDIAVDNYISAKQGIAKMDDLTDREDTTTIYFSCGTAGEIMEVEYFT